MSIPNKKKKGGKKVLLVLVSIVLLAVAAYFMMSNEQKRQLFETLGIENSEVVADTALESFVSVRNVTSRQAILGDDWIIKGQLFNTHESRAIKKVKLMFNFEDGVETVWLNETISAQNALGKKFKERISGHGGSAFLSVTVLDAE